MPGIVISIGGKLDKSLPDSLYQAAVMAKQQERKMATVRDYAPTQLAKVNKALATLPAESLMRPRLLAMREELQRLGGEAGAGAAKGFFAKFTSNLQGHGGGGIAQLIHTVRAGFDSIASGAPLWRVALQQAPQALQAFASMGGSAALKFILGFAKVLGSIGAIIAAPFIYFSRVDGLAERLAPRKLLDFAREYVPLVDRMADGLYRMAQAAKKVNEEYAGATASAARMQKVLDDQFATQRQLDALRKASEITKAHGDARKIAEIESRYDQLDVSRTLQKAHADKAAKIAEQAALEKELAKLEKRKSAITYGDEDKHKQVLETAKKSYDDSKKLLDEEAARPENTGDEHALYGWLRKQGRYLSAGVRSGGLVAGMANPQGGNNLTQEYLTAEAGKKQADIENARAQVAQYEKLLSAEKNRNRAIEERNRLQGDSEKNAARLAQLGKEIADADKEAARANTNMQAIAAAKKANANTTAQFAGGSGQASVTERERSGFRSGNEMQVSIIAIAKKHLGESEKLNTRMERIEKILVDGGY